MAEMKCGSLPAPAALVTGVETPEGQSVAVGLARAGCATLGLFQHQRIRVAPLFAKHGFHKM